MSTNYEITEEAVVSLILGFIEKKSIDEVSDHVGQGRTPYSRILVRKNPNYYNSNKVDWAQIISALIHGKYWSNFVAYVLETVEQGSIYGLLVDFPFRFRTERGFTRIFDRIPLSERLYDSFQILDILNGPFEEFTGPEMIDGIAVKSIKTIYKIPNTRFIITSQMENEMTSEERGKIVEQLERKFPQWSNYLIRNLRGSEGVVIDLPIVALDNTIDEKFAELTRETRMIIKKVPIWDENDIRLLEMEHFINADEAEKAKKYMMGNDLEIYIQEMTRQVKNYFASIA